MRTALALTALLVVLALPVSAQMDIDTSYYVRIGLGDIPTTDVVEPSDAWNVVEYMQVQHDGNQTVIQHRDVGNAAIFCDGCTVAVQGTTITIGNDVSAGAYQLSLAHSHPAGSSFGVPFALFGPALASDAKVTVYAPAGFDVSAPVDEALRLPMTSAPGDIVQFHGTTDGALPDGFWLTLSPATGATNLPEGSSFDYLALALGAVAGMALWALLVQRGMVQKRSRKQVASQSAHQSAKAAESPEVLAARKRLLMAGLKDLEVAKMNKDIDDAAYDQLKAEWKKQTVTVMRALEDADS